MAKTGITSQGLRAAIERSGYYPAVVADAVEDAVGGAPVRAYLVYQETTFESAELRRHVTVLVLAGSRLVVSHTDEHGADGSSPQPYATTLSESVALNQIKSISVNRMVADPAQHKPGALPCEVYLTVSWGTQHRIDLEPARCPDPNCEADHGYHGTAAGDDVQVRVSEAADGPEAVAEALDFARVLSTALAALD
ncbi:DUF5998 family protein [Allostreptomyces psammosilenae]|uniref:Phosphodiesterase n=1 Tax=Allostreptomyces psammosilenae TaxID=1892865 RepID=A0A852ZYF6_9ACTN|nr:DUF5998 family protein [Allostreptomyces psammosilenae]NYI03128.1 hypothetical protein [Allostreptomyces psammosilenae]